MLELPLHGKKKWCHLGSSTFAKKKKEEVVEEPLVENTVVAEPEVVQEIFVEQKPKRVVPKNKTLSDGWELKNRIYRLKGNKKPLSRSIKSANIHYFDEEKGYERELKYCSNQKTSTDFSVRKHPNFGYFKDFGDRNSILMRLIIIFLSKYNLITKKILILGGGMETLARN